MYTDDEDARELSRRDLIATAAFVPLAALTGANPAAAQTAAAAPAAEEDGTPGIPACAGMALNR